MAHPTGESKDGVLKLDFDRRLMLQFRGSVITSDAGLLAYRELDDAIGLSAVAGETLADTRTGKNGRHALVGLLRQSVFGRLAGYDDVNDAERLRHDPAMRWIVGGKAAHGSAASPSQMGRFETRWLTVPALTGIAAPTRARERGARRFQRALTQSDLLEPPGRRCGCWSTSPFRFSGLVRRFWFGATMELGRSMMMSAGAGAARPTGSSTTDRKICSTDSHKRATENTPWAMRQ
jgi:Transposase DDE domain group 1